MFATSRHSGQVLTGKGIPMIKDVKKLSDTESSNAIGVSNLPDSCQNMMKKEFIGKIKHVNYVIHICKRA